MNKSNEDGPSKRDNKICLSTIIYRLKASFKKSFPDAQIDTKVQNILNEAAVRVKKGYDAEIVNDQGNLTFTFTKRRWRGRT